MADNPTTDTGAQPTGLLGNELSMEEAIDQQIGADPPPADTPADPLETEAELEDTDGAFPELDTLDDEAETDADDPELEAAEPVEQPPDDTQIQVGDEQISLTELKRGHLRQADYSRKTQALQTERQAFDNELAQMRQERAEYAQLQVMKMQLQESVLGQPPVESSFGDPLAYLRAKDLYREQSDALRMAQAGFAETQQRQANDLSLQQSQALQRGSEQLLNDIPEWKDATIAANEHAEIRDFLLTEAGYTQDEVDNLVDPRAVKIARDALLGHNIRTGKELKAKRKAKTGATLRATGEPTPKPKARSLKSANERLNKTGDIDDAVELQLAQLGRKDNSHGRRRSTH